jgi:hypothetical protein
MKNLLFNHTRLYFTVFFVMSLIMLSACSGGEGSITEQEPKTPTEQAEKPSETPKEKPSVVEQAKENVKEN